MKKMALSNCARNAAETLFNAIVAAILAFGLLLLLLLLVALAVGAKAIDVQHIHTAPQF